jgi:tetratricopeptide (TPR) repeat protein
MSDSQIQMHMAQMGMPNMDPQAFRSMCRTMSEMDDSQLNNMKNMAQSNFNSMNMNNNNYNNNYTNTTNNSNTTNKIEGTIIGQVTKMKEEGNKLFKQNKYDEAIKKYYETIEEINTSTDKDKYKNELAELEKQCRLNIANCKLKTKDFDGVINECSIVLENNKCFKAYYRMGLALFQKKKYDKAFRYLDNANAIGTPSEKTAVEPHLKECKEKLDKIKKKEREERKKKEKEKEKEKEENKETKIEPILNNRFKNEIEDDYDLINYSLIFENNFQLYPQQMDYQGNTDCESKGKTNQEFNDKNINAKIKNRTLDFMINDFNDNISQKNVHYKRKKEKGRNKKNQFE